MNFQKSSHKPILGQNGQVADLVTRARRIHRLDRAVRRMLEPSLAQHCRVATCRNEVLVLEAASAAWGSRLRLQLAALQQQLQQNRVPVRRIEVRIRPELDQTATARRTTPRRRLSANAARSIQAAADASPDPDLSAALRRLAKHARDTD